ncbi:response regulator [Patescibacteria group bacterium]|jgi:CheY-like chemotaxis protein|nr:response regulator [Patescibacteria group bacterium]
MKGRNRSPRLLVVDDDPSVAAAYRLILEEPNRAGDSDRTSRLDDLEAELFGTSEIKEEKHDWRIQFLDQGIDAVSEIRRSLEANDPVTAIFLDVRMPPGIDGYETARQIRLLDRGVHIVIVTAFSDYSYEDFLLVAGPADRLNYLPKPIWPHELRQVAQVLMSEKGYSSLPDHAHVE